MSSNVAERQREEMILAAAERKLRKVRCEKDLLLFLNTYLAYHFDEDFGDFQLEFIQELQDSVGQGSKICRAAPREHAKTTIVQGFLVWCGIYKKKNFACVICESREKAEIFMTMPKEEFESNDMILEDFGEMRTKATWTKKTLVLANKFVLMARGPKTQIRGLKWGKHRPDLLLIDDLEDDDSVENLELRDQMEAWFKRAVMNAVVKTGDIIMVGTKLHHDAVICRILENEDDNWPNWDCKTYAVYKDDGASLWPAVWPKERIEKKRVDVGAQAFATEFMNNPTDKYTQAFKNTHVNWYDPVEIIGGVDKKGVRHEPKILSLVLQFHRAGSLELAETIRA